MYKTLAEEYPVQFVDIWQVVRELCLKSSSKDLRQEKLFPSEVHCMDCCMICLYNSGYVVSR